MAELKLEEFCMGSNMEDYSSADPEMLDIFGLGSANIPAPVPMIFGPENANIPAIASVKEAGLQGIFQKHVDKQLLQATMTVLRTGKLTPLIMEELKCTIQKRRLARGEEELIVDMSPPPGTDFSLSTEEKARLDTKRRARREMNRFAAQKSRRKRKVQKEETMEQCRQLEAKNRELQLEYENLSREKSIILKALEDLRYQCQQPSTSTAHYSPI